MGRARKRGNGLPGGVYWQNRAWRYKAKDAHERGILGKTWVRLGTTHDHVHENYWPLVGKKIGAKSGMLELWQLYKKQAFPKQSVRHRGDNEKMWALLRPMFVHVHPTAITRTWGIRFLKKRGIQGIPPFEPAPSRAAKEFALLRHMLTIAHDEGIITSNPLKGINVTEILKLEVRDRVPDVWELIAVKKHAPIDICLFIDFKYMTGLDQSTCFKLLVPSFDGPGIPVKRSKTNKKGYIQWNSELEQICRELIAYNNNRCPTLFCNTKGSPMQVDTFSQRFRRYVKGAIEAGDLVEPFTPNDIRSSHGTDAEEIYGLDSTKQLLNSEGARRHYVHKRRGEKITALPRPSKANTKV